MILNLPGHYKYLVDEVQTCSTLCPGQRVIARIVLLGLHCPKHERTKVGLNLGDAEFMNMNRPGGPRTRGPPSKLLVLMCFGGPGAHGTNQIHMFRGAKHWFGQIARTIWGPLTF